MRMSGCRVRAVPPATVRRHEPAEIPPAGGPARRGGHPRGRAGPLVRGPRDRRATGDDREGAPAPAVEVPAAMGRREPPLLQLVRSTRAAGPQRGPDRRPPHDGAAPLNRSFPVRAARTATALLCTAALAAGAV